MAAYTAPGMRTGHSWWEGGHRAVVGTGVGQGLALCVPVLRGAGGWRERELGCARAPQRGPDKPLANGVGRTRLDLGYPCSFRTLQDPTLPLSSFRGPGPGSGLRLVVFPSPEEGRGEGVSGGTLPGFDCGSAPCPFVTPGYLRIYLWKAPDTEL